MTEESFKKLLKKIDEENMFFDDVNLDEIGISKLSKKELLELIKVLNKNMIKSTEYWDGG